ncbi:uncharacterized protein BX664DRAFT_326439 [Halteromyces radiatus]|uniref:uncharacterized protein n=1 Tax=Halteromyces radiatus TaxID=101107 RepID=UPI00221EA871|nr:uncharacterized protein BX664DRAFT_326439 [Halteromyces radiatus]KAI8097465.1 hypothetical protein BX664DRAFT_326439 [Halteromyces radiatus]
MSDDNNRLTPHYDDSVLTITGIASQLGINVAIALLVLMIFTILRPNNSLVYAPKYKYSTNTKRPPAIGHGYFTWFKIIKNTPDEVLLEKIGYDAVLFIAFIRMLRKLLFIMTIVGVCLLIPLNVLANRFTGPWPPELSVDVLSFATINTAEDESRINLSWYWIHCIGTWGFSLLIYYHLFIHYHKYLRFRQHYFASPEYQRSPHARTLIIFNVPSAMQSDEALASWVKRMNLKYPVEQVCIGRRNNTLAKYVEEHEEAVRKLEIILSQYLEEEDKIDAITNNKKRPQIRLGGFMGCCGGRKVDAIEYYTERIRTLRDDINKIRTNIDANKPTNYGWISFSNVAWAHSTAKHLASPAASHLLRLPERLLKGETHHQLPRVELAPQPKDILWNNLSLNEHVRRSKRIVVTVLYYAFVFFWFIPSSLLSASSNVKDFIKLFPNSDVFLHEHRTFVALLSSWFTPLVMAVFFLILPKVMRLLSKHQGYFTHTSVDRQIFAKLYTFFLINNLLVFTVASTLMKLYTQIKNAAQGGQVLTFEGFFITMGENLVLVAKNLSDVSNYWLSYVTLKGLGVTIDLAQIFVLLTITLRKLFTKPSPRQLQELTRPSQFDYPVFYNLLIFFFTVGLLYSVISPLVLPFAMIYFMLATMVFKYLLMYVFVTGVETGGQMWRILFNRMIVSILLFQVVMIGILKLKDAGGPAYSCVPLPIFTALFKFYCLRRLDRHAYYYKPGFVDDLSLFGQSRPTNTTLTTTQSSTPSSSFINDTKSINNSSIKSFYSSDNKSQHHLAIGQRFGDPAFFSELPIPMVHDKVRHLLPGLYGTQSQTQQKTVTSKLTRQKSVRHVSMIQLPGQGMPFQSIKEDELENDDSTEGLKGYYKFDDDQDDDYHNEDTNPNSNYNQNYATPVDATTVGALAVGNEEATKTSSDYKPLSKLPASQLSPKRKSMLGSLFKESPSTLLTGATRSAKMDPYSATRPLMMDDDNFSYTTHATTKNKSTDSIHTIHTPARLHGQTIRQETQYYPDVIEMSPFDQEQAFHSNQAIQQQSHQQNSPYYYP